MVSFFILHFLHTLPYARQVISGFLCFVVYVDVFMNVMFSAVM